MTRNCDKSRETTLVPADPQGSSGFRSSLITSQEQRAGLFSGFQPGSHSDGPVDCILATFRLSAQQECFPSHWTGALHSHLRIHTQLLNVLICSSTIKSSKPNTPVQSISKPPPHPDFPRFSMRLPSYTSQDLQAVLVVCLHQAALQLLSNSLVQMFPPQIAQNVSSWSFFAPFFFPPTHIYAVLAERLNMPAGLILPSNIYTSLFANRFQTFPHTAATVCCLV